MSPQIRGATWLGLTVILGALLAAGIPAGLAQVPWGVERSLSNWLVLGDEPTACTGQNDREGRAALNRLVSRLYPLYPDDAALPVHVELVEGSTVNAFAGLAGRIEVFAGLLSEATSPEELAGVLAHEIEHVRRRHVIQGTFLSLLNRAVVSLWVNPEDAAVGSLASLFLQLQFSQAQETQADAGALARLRDARIDPSGLVRFFERAGEKSGNFLTFMSSHPANSARAEALRSDDNGTFEPVLTPLQWHALQQLCAKPPKD